MGHVLLVHDDDNLRRLGALVLEAAGHTVAMAATDAEALAHCGNAANRLTAVIIHLSRHTIGRGVELAGQVANARPEAIVTACSGGIRHVPNGVPAGVRLLPKPLSLAQFHAAAGVV